MRKSFAILLCFIVWAANAQTLGGNAVYNFLKLQATPMLTAAGGVNVSYKTNEVGLAANNPALLHPELNSQVNLSFNSFLAGIKTYSLTGAYQYNQLNTTLGGHIYFVDYGATAQTDAAGNVSGVFRPVDFVIQLSGARQYLDKWNYGASVKFIRSDYGLYRSSALAVDVGVHYSDSTHQVYASLLAKNMGMQLKTYAGESEDLPFDLQAGITKILAHAPFGFSLTAQHLHRFNISYHDTVFNNANNVSGGDHFLGKLINHFIAAAHVYLGANLEATFGYNHLRRTELNTGVGGNGLNGFSIGLRIKFQKLQVLYARANYQKNISYNQLGLTLQLNKLFTGKDL